MLRNVKKDSRVKRVNVTDSILTEKAKMGDEEYSNLMFIFKSDENIKLLKKDLSSIAETAPRLQKGEIYVSQGFLTNVYGNVGEKIIIETTAGEYEFTVKGILLDPMFGSSMIGYTAFYISDGDFSEITSAITKFFLQRTLLGAVRKSLLTL